MNKTKKPEVIILSGELSNQTKLENQSRTADLYKSLRSLNIPFKTVVGVYKGVKEESFVTTPRDASEFSTVLSLASHFDQESVLHLDSNRRAKLIFRGGQVEHLGYFTSVPEKIARAQDAYTQDGDDFYIVRKA